MIMVWYTEALGSVGAGESKGFRLERCGCFELEPLFSGERVDHFLLLSLLAVAFFTFALSHRLNIQIFYKLNIKNRGIYFKGPRACWADGVVEVEGWGKVGMAFCCFFVLFEPMTWYLFRVLLLLFPWCLSELLVYFKLEYKYCLIW